MQHAASHPIYFVCLLLFHICALFPQFTRGHSHGPGEGWCREIDEAPVGNHSGEVLELLHEGALGGRAVEKLFRSVLDYSGCRGVCEGSLNCSFTNEIITPPEITNSSTSNQESMFEDLSIQLLWLLSNMNDNCSFRRNASAKVKEKKLELVNLGFNNASNSSNTHGMLDRLFLSDNRLDGYCRKSRCSTLQTTLEFTANDVARVVFGVNSTANKINFDNIGKVAKYVVYKIIKKECYAKTEVNLPSPFELKKEILAHFSNESCTIDKKDLSEIMLKLNIPESNQEIKNQCFDADTLFRIHGHHTDSTLSAQSFSEICPTLLHQALIGCRQEEEEKDEHPVNRSTSELYGYSTLAVLLISIPPFLAIFIVKFKNSRAYRYVIAGMLGLGVGSLISDTFLHLLPHILLPEIEIDVASIPIFFWKLVALCATVWVYFLLQLTIQSVMKIKEDKKEETDRIETSFPAESYSNIKSNSEDLPNSHHGSHAVGWMVTIGDLFHNFTDGLAIGGAFSLSNKVGISTTLAIFCHEIPQELGDAALMLATGWTWRRVLFFNCIAQASAFAGLYIGISISQSSSDAESWILAVTGGTFVYLALADAVPEILDICGKGVDALILIVPNLGVFCGYVIMIVIALYEEQISV